jgi:hypothetical protein
MLAGSEALPSGLSRALQELSPQPHLSLREFGRPVDYPTAGWAVQTIQIA